MAAPRRGSAAGKVRVVSSVAQSGPEVLKLEDGDGVVRARSTYEVVLG
jgi:hypothetical protein